MSFMRGRAGATGRAERSTPYTRWRPVSHMASATITRPAPGPDPAAGRRSRPRSWPMLALRRARAGHADRVPDLPDLSQLRQLLLAAVGPRAAARGQAVLRRLPHADRAPARRRLRGAALDRRRSGRPDHGRRHAGVVRRPRRRPLPPGARRRSGRSSGWRPPPCCARASTSPSWPRAATSTSRTWPSSCGRRRSRPSARGAAPSVFVLLACAGLMRPEAWLLSGLYWLWCILPASWPQRITLLACSPAPRRSSGPRLDWWATGDPKFSLTHTSGLAEELGRTSGGLAGVPSTTVKFLKSLDKVPVFYAGILGVVIAVLLTPRRARMPLALLVIGLGTFVLVGLAGLSVIDRYLLVPSLRGHGLRGRRARRLDDAALRARAHGCGRSGRWRSSSTAWPSRPPGSTSRPSPTS